MKPRTWGLWAAELLEERSRPSTSLLLLSLCSAAVPAQHSACFTAFNRCSIDVMLLSVGLHGFLAGNCHLQF